jgi:7-cyano-7-deazaguanine synthase
LEIIEKRGEMVPAASPPAVVLVSGGLDSATVLALAREQGFRLFALSFDYGQRHRFELEAARKVCAAQPVERHIVLELDLRAFGGSALTAEIDVPKDRDVGGASSGSPRDDAHGLQSVGVENAARAEHREDVPITYVPARNTIFLSFAIAFAEVRNARDIFIGVNAVDYSGYPDCRPEYIAAFETMANLATRAGVEGQRLRIHTPLLDLTKGQIIRRGIELGVDYALTRSCYDPAPPHGLPCGHCDSCLLRAAGFKEAGVRDPLLR